MSRIYTIGEVLIDFVPQQKGTPLKDVKLFERAAGGAPANVAVCVAKLGGQATLLSQVGHDAFGRHLIEIISASGVDTSYVKTTSQAPTALAFVALDASGNRDFSFYRQPCADLLYSPSDVPVKALKAGDFLHFGSVDLVESPMKKAHETAIDAAIQAGAIISFDPNVRKPLWSDLTLYQKTIQAFLPKAEILKVSDDELSFITGIQEEAKAIASLFTGRVRYVVLTRGSQGAQLYIKGQLKVSIPAMKTTVVDTTGAGDSFIGSLLYQLAAQGVTTGFELPLPTWQKFFDFSAKTAAIVVSRPGGIPAMPTKQEVERFGAK